MARNAKMAAERTCEPCEKGTNDPAVQRSLFKISKSKKGLNYEEGLNKVLRDVVEHQISLRKSSKDND